MRGGSARLRPALGRCDARPPGARDSVSHPEISARAASHPRARNLAGGHRSLAAVAGLLSLLLPPMLVSARSTETTEMSDPAPLAAKTLLLDIARAGDRLVAVGAHGIVVVSDDEGRSWRQIIVPTRTLLTAVSFADNHRGWSVGHDGVILATTNGGDAWTRQDSGRDLQTVFLDVLFLDPLRGFAVGAYGKFMATVDGGRTWTPAQPAPDEPHLNRIARTGDRLALAGEMGTLLFSDDHGGSWQPADLPYDGSLFGIVTAPAGEPIVVCGLRGHVLVSDTGEDWRELATEAPVLLMAGLRLADATIVLAGQGGNLFVSRDRGRTFARWRPEDFGTAVADLVATGDGHLVVVGEAGATRLPQP